MGLRQRPAYGLSLRVEYDHCRDGDTVVVRLPHSERIWVLRLIDVWCAETKRGPSAERVKGKAAKRFAESVLEQTDELSVYIPEPHDAVNLLANLTFDRIPSWLFVASDRTLNDMLVEAGHATKEKP